MVAYYERQTSRAAMWSRGVALFAALLFAVAAVAHRAGLLETMGFIWILAVVALLAVLALILAAWGFSRLWRFGDRGGRASAWGMLIALGVLAPFLWAAWNVAANPRLMGVSTDTAAPPELTAASQGRSGAMNQIGPISDADALLQEEHYPDVAGRRYESPPDQVALAVEAIMDSRGWEILSRNGDPLLNLQTTIEALAHTPVLGFPSDVAIRLTDEGGATFVDMRSVSHFGRHDLGSNARRVAAFMADLDAAMMSRTAQ